MQSQTPKWYIIGNTVRKQGHHKNRILVGHCFISFVYMMTCSQQSFARLQSLYKTFQILVGAYSLLYNGFTMAGSLPLTPYFDLKMYKSHPITTRPLKIDAKNISISSQV